MRFDFNIEFNRIIGLCYTAEDDNFHIVFDRVVYFLDSDAPRELKVRALFALFQATIENGILNDASIDNFQRLLEDRYRDILIEVLNQKDFIDFFIKNASYPEGYVSVFVPEVDQLFSDDTVLYALSHKNIRSGFSTLFACHPVILRNTELQREAFSRIKAVPNILGYCKAVYVTDEVIDSFSAEDQLFVFWYMAFHKKVKKIAFSPEKIKNTALLFLIGGNDMEKGRAKDCLKYLERNAIEYISAVPPIKFDIDPNKYKIVSMDELANMDSVLAAIELLHPNNVGRMLRLLSLFLNKHPKKKNRKRVYFKFRNKLISVMKKSPWQVAAALYFSKETDAALRLLNDSGFRNVAETLRSNPKIHGNFTFYMREIDYYLERKRIYSQSVSE